MAEDTSVDDDVRALRALCNRFANHAKELEATRCKADRLSEERAAERLQWDEQYAEMHERLEVAEKGAADTDHRVQELTVALRRLLHRSKVITVYVDTGDDPEDEAQLHKFEIAHEVATDVLGEKGGKQ